MTLSKHALCMLTGTSVSALATVALAQTVKIPQLPAAGALSGKELMIVDQNVSTRQVTLDAIQDYIQDNLPSVLTELGFTPLNKAGDTMSGALGLTTVPPLDLTYSLTPANMANVLKFGDGNMISYAPPLSCLSTSSRCGSAPTNDHQRTSVLISATTQADNQAEEQTLGIVTQIVSGAKSNWAAATSYAAGANVASNGNIYRAASTCTSGSTAPSGFGNATTQSDGGCTWTWINASAISTKLGQYMETAVNGGAGFSEGLVTNMGLQPAQYSVTGKAFDVAQGAVGIEHDFSNNTGTDAAPGVSNLLGMSIAMSGSNKSLTGVQLDGSGGSHGGSNYATFWGMRFVNKLASEFTLDFMDTAATAVGFGVDGFGSVTRTGPTIRDGSTAPVSYQAEGHFTNGISLSGIFDGAQIVGKNFVLYPDGTQDIGKQIRLLPDAKHVLQITYDAGNDQSVIQSTHTGVYNTTLALNPAGGLVQAGSGGFAETLTTPTSSSAPCVAGQFTDDANYHYVCVAANTWKRVALSAF